MSRFSMSSADVVEFLGSQRELSMSSVDPDGSIHVVAMWFALIDEQIGMLAFSRSRKARNVRRNPIVTCMVSAGEQFDDLRGVTVAGRAVATANPEDVLRVAHAMSAKYAGLWSMIEASLSHRVAIILEPTRITSWDHRRMPRP